MEVISVVVGQRTLLYKTVCIQHLLTKHFQNGSECDRHILLSL